MKLEVKKTNLALSIRRLFSPFTISGRSDEQLLGERYKIYDSLDYLFSSPVFL